jgi:hypothetical protein
MLLPACAAASEPAQQQLWHLLLLQLVLMQKLPHTPAAVAAA